jgi:hypothetical protein
MREPDFERKVFAVAGDVREHFHEGVLHRLVGIVCVAQVLIGDSHGPPLLARHQIPVPVPRGVTLAPDDEGLYFRRQLRVPRQGRNRCDSTDVDSH